jgi:transposase
MRVATLFKRLPRLGGERVVGVDLVEEEGAERVIVTLALRRRRAMRCSGCGRRVRGAYDSRPMSWRHLDLGRVRCLIRCEIRRVECSRCGVRVEAVPWARAGSRFTRPFEDICVYLARAAPKTTVAAPIRVDRHTVGPMIERVVAEHVAAQPGDGMDGLTRIGIDEVAYRKDTATSCASATTTAATWSGRSPDAATRPPRPSTPPSPPSACAALRAVSLDLHGGWITATRTHAPNALICADPFHVIARRRCA